MIFHYSFSYSVLIVVAICYSNVPVQSATPDYCLSPLNTSDCGKKPTPVFYYYKPGSRCEINWWRGCPTYNIFVDEYECSDKCIYRVQYAESTDLNDCDQVMDIRQCRNVTKLAYTHIGNGTCVQVKWGGCPSPNVFVNKESCELACNQVLFNELVDLDEVKLKQVETLLEDMIKEDAVKLFLVSTPSSAQHNLTSFDYTEMTSITSGDIEDSATLIEDEYDTIPSIDMDDSATSSLGIDDMTIINEDDVVSTTTPSDTTISSEDENDMKTPIEDTTIQSDSVDEIITPNFDQDDNTIFENEDMDGTAIVNGDDNGTTDQDLLADGTSTVAIDVDGTSTLTEDMDGKSTLGEEVDSSSTLSQDDDFTSTLGVVTDDTTTLTPEDNDDTSTPSINTDETTIQTISTENTSTPSVNENLTISSTNEENSTIESSSKGVESSTSAIPIEGNMTTLDENSTVVISKLKVKVNNTLPNTSAPSEDVIVPLFDDGFGHPEYINFKNESHNLKRSKKIKTQ